MRVDDIGETGTRPGTLLAGRYQVDRLLGEGAAGFVWLARDTRKRGLVWAVKELDFSGMPPGEQREMLDHFEREATLLMLLEHDSLPQVVDRFSEEGHEFLVMERVEGPTLEQILQRRGRPLDESDVLDWALQLCDVLDYLHSRIPPVIYRDLKPANVMLSVHGRIKLIDFGIARTQRPGRHGDTVAYGTPGYAPPEQYMGRAEPRSDLYALGATLYRLLTAQPVGEAERTTPGTSLPPAQPFRFDAVRQHNPSSSAETEAVVAECLEQDPRDRPGSARIVHSRIEDARAAPRRRTWWQSLEQFFSPRSTP